MYFKPVILLKDPNIVSHVHRYMPVIPELRSCGKRIKTFDAKMIQEFSGVQGSWVHSEKESTGKHQQQRSERFYLQRRKRMLGACRGTQK
jgi:hypothetical protein